MLTLLHNGPIKPRDEVLRQGIRLYSESQQTEIWWQISQSVQSLSRPCSVVSNSFFFLIFISWRLITLQYCSVFLPYIDMNQPWIYMCSPSWSPLPLPPFGSSQCTSPEHLSHASNLGWRSVSHLIIYMFQCYSVRSSHPRLLPQSPKVCSIHLLWGCRGWQAAGTWVSVSPEMIGFPAPIR